MNHHKKTQALKSIQAFASKGKAIIAYCICTASILAPSTSIAEDSREILNHTNTSQIEYIKKISKNDIHRLEEVSKQLQAAGNYTEMVKMVELIYAWYKSNFGENDGTSAAMLNSLSNAYVLADQLDKAETTRLKLHNILIRFLGDNHEMTTKNLSDLADIYLKQGRPAKALGIWLNLLDSKKQAKSLNFETAELLIKIGQAYLKLGLIDKARKPLEEALKIQLKGQSFAKIKQAKASDNKLVNTILSLSVVAKDNGDKEKVNELLITALEIGGRYRGKNHPDYAEILSWRGNYLNDIGEYSKALLDLFKAEKIIYSTLGYQSTHLLGIYNNIAISYSKQGYTSKAAEYLKKAITIAEVNNKSLQKSIIQANLAAVLQAANNQEESANLFAKAFDNHIKVIQSEAALLPNLNRLDYVKDELRIYDSIYSLNLNNSQIAKSALHFRLNRNGFLQDIEARQEQLKRETLKNPAANNLLDEIRIIKGILDLPLTDRGIKNKHQKKLELLETKFFGLIPNFLIKPTTIKEVSAALPRNSVLIEFQKYRPAQYKPRLGMAIANLNVSDALIWNKNSLLCNLPPKSSLVVREVLEGSAAELQKFKFCDIISSINGQIPLTADAAKDIIKNVKPGVDLVFNITRAGNIKKIIAKPRFELLFDNSEEYMALIVDDENNISYVPLGTAKEIDQLIYQASTSSSANNTDASYFWNAVSDKVMRPLLKTIAARNYVFISPDGELHKIPFATLSNPSKPVEMLGQSLNLVQLTSGRDLVSLQKENTPRPANASLVMADPDFEFIHKKQEKRLKYSHQGNEGLNSPADIKGVSFNALPGTRMEAIEVAKLLNTTPVMGQNATEELLKKANSPFILHLATHGFAYNNISGNSGTKQFGNNREAPVKKKNIENSQNYSIGIAMTGANYRAAGPQEDGIVNESEIASLNLKGTELVVISACSSAQGSIYSGEGIFGIQRSLVVAGARSSLLSLWKVEDLATAEFMARYYRKLKIGSSRVEALTAVQNEFRNGTAGNGKWKEPYYWAAWKLVGDWRTINGL